MADEPAAKRMKGNEEEPAPPSPVLHVRNLPLDATDYELRLVFPNAHQILALVLLKGKGQAFVQFSDVQASTYALNYFTANKAMVRHKQIYFQYSRRTELENVHQNIAASSAAAALATAPVPTRPGCVLHVTVSDCFYPISIDLLVTVFQVFGTVTKIILLSKTETAGTTQALIQYGDENQAEAARASLNGKQLFDGAGLLKVQTSKFENLKIMYNNDRSRDFTAVLPYGPAGAGVAAPGMPSMHALPGAVPGAVPPQLASAAGPASMHGIGSMGYGAQDLGSPVVLVNKLNEEQITPDALFNLLGVYGDVQRVKILYNKRHTALIQMTNGQQAQLVVRMLNNVPLFGKAMALTVSSHTQVKLPRPDSEEANTKNTVSYEKSEFHRFAIAGSKNYNNIVPPSSYLHLSNIPDGITEDQLKALFGQYGTVIGFRFFANTNKMAILTMSALGEAVDALACLHQYPLTEGHRLRVSFAKKSN